MFFLVFALWVLLQMTGKKSNLNPSFEALLICSTLLTTIADISFARLLYRVVVFWGVFSAFGASGQDFFALWIFFQHFFSGFRILSKMIFFQIFGRRIAFSIFGECFLGNILRCWFVCLVFWIIFGGVFWIFLDRNMCRVFVLRHFLCWNTYQLNLQRHFNFRFYDFYTFFLLLS